MAFPQVASTYNVAYGSGTTTENVISGLTVTTGDLLLVIYCHSMGAGTQTYATPSGWEKLAEVEVLSSYHYYVLAKAAAGGDTCNIDRNVGSGRTMSAVAYAISGWGGSVGSTSAATWTGAFSSTDVEGHQQTFSSSSTPNHGGVTASWGSADNLFITYLANSRDATAWPYANNQVASTTFASGRPVIQICSKESASASDDPGAWTLAASATGTMGTIVVEPSAGASAVAGISRHYARMMTG